MTVYTTISGASTSSSPRSTGRAVVAVLALPFNLWAKYRRRQQVPDDVWESELRQPVERKGAEFRAFL